MRRRATRAAAGTFMVLRGPRDLRAGLELGGLQGSPLHDAWPLWRCPPFIAGRWAGTGFQGKKMSASYRGSYVRIAQFC